MAPLSVSTYNQRGFIMANQFQSLKNEYTDGGSKSMIEFTDAYVAADEYDDTFDGFLEYLYEIEGRLDTQTYKHLTEQIQTTP